MIVKLLRPLRLRQLAMMSLTVLIVGCASAPPQTTVLQAGDMDEATARMAQSLIQSHFLADRAPDSPRIVVMIDKIENQTTDIIPAAEEWMLMARVQGQMPIQSLAKQKNIHFQLPPERAQMVQGAGYQGPIETGSTPTHLMSATFFSATRSARNSSGNLTDHREEYYRLQYQLTGLNSREVLWTDSFEFKRESKGNVID